MWLDRWRLKVPVVSSIYLSLAVSRFCRVLGTLLTGGVPIVRSLEISADSTGNRVLSAAVREAAENISAGQSLAAAAGRQRPFSGRRRRNDRRRPSSRTTWKPCCPHIADTLERDTWRRLDLFVRLLEPLMLLLLAGVVLLVVIALLGAGFEDERRGVRISYNEYCRLRPCLSRCKESRSKSMSQTKSLNVVAASSGRGRLGFTLMEVLLVLMILVVLASMAVTIFGGTQEQALKDAAKGAGRPLQERDQLYKFHTKNYPGSLNDLVDKPGDSKVAERWDGPVSRRHKIPLDPWDNEYKIRRARQAQHRVVRRLVDRPRRPGRHRRRHRQLGIACHGQAGHARSACVPFAPALTLVEVLLVLALLVVISAVTMPLLSNSIVLRAAAAQRRVGAGRLGHGPGSLRCRRANRTSFATSPRAAAIQIVSLSAIDGRRRRRRKRAAAGRRGRRRVRRGRHAAALQEPALPRRSCSPRARWRRCRKWRRPRRPTEERLVAADRVLPRRHHVRRRGALRQRRAGRTLRVTLRGLTGISRAGRSRATP